MPYQQAQSFRNGLLTNHFVQAVAFCHDVALGVARVVAGGLIITPDLALRILEHCRAVVAVLDVAENIPGGVGKRLGVHSADSGDNVVTAALDELKFDLLPRFHIIE